MNAIRDGARSCSARPGSGKGTQAEAAERVPWTSRTSRPATCCGSTCRRDGLGQRGRGDRWTPGQLVSDELVNRMVEERLAEPDCARRVHPGRVSAHGRAGRGAAEACWTSAAMAVVVIHLHGGLQYNYCPHYRPRGECPGLWRAVQPGFQPAQGGRACATWMARRWSAATDDTEDGDPEAAGGLRRADAAAGGVFPAQRHAGSSRWTASEATSPEEMLTTEIRGAV